MALIAIVVFGYSIKARSWIPDSIRFGVIDPIEDKARVLNAHITVAVQY